MLSPGFCIKSWRLALTVLEEYFCLKDLRKLVFMVTQLFLSMQNVSKLSHQAWAGPQRMVESSQTMQRTSQVAISVAASIQLSGIAQWLYPWFHLRGTGAGQWTISGGRGWSGHLGRQWG